MGEGTALLLVRWKILHLDGTTQRRSCPRHGYAEAKLQLRQGRKWASLFQNNLWHVRAGETQIPAFAGMTIALLDSMRIHRTLAFVILLLAMVMPARAEVVRAEDHDSFWLWAGVEPQGMLARARELYLLAGEVSDRGHPHVISQRSATPHVANADVWIVYRAQTIDWNDAVLDEVLAHVESWRAAGNRIVGLQIDFDAGTKHLERYAEFLGEVRARLPGQYRLGVTGLLDWSANGDPAGLDALAGVVDEVVLQIYQGHHVIPGYERYLAKLDRMKVAFRIGLLQGGEWQAPPLLAMNDKFRGYVVFLLNPSAR